MDSSSKAQTNPRERLNMLRPTSLTICICTFNRPQELLIALASLERSMIPVENIVVSDDGSADQWEQLIAGGFSRVRYVHGPQRGIAANRNNALRYVDSDYVMFLDDDDELDEHFVAKMVEFISAIPDAARERTIVTGTEIKSGKLVLPGRLSFLGYQELAYDGDTALRTINNTSTFFPRALFDAIGFDENLMYGCEDVDLPLRATAAGYTIQLCREAVNHHSPSPINRTHYRKYVDASRVYVTFKRYAFIDRKFLAAAAFVLIVPIQQLRFHLRLNGMFGLRTYADTLILAAKYVFRYVTSIPKIDRAPERAMALPKSD